MIFKLNKILDFMIFLNFKKVELVFVGDLYSSARELNQNDDQSTSKSGLSMKFYNNKTLVLYHAKSIWISIH